MHFKNHVASFNSYHQLLNSKYKSITRNKNKTKSFIETTFNLTLAEII